MRFSWKFLNQWKLNENYYAVYVKSHLVFFDSSTIFYQLSFHATLHHNLECQYLIQNLQQKKYLFILVSWGATCPAILEETVSPNGNLLFYNFQAQLRNLSVYFNYYAELMTKLLNVIRMYDNMVIHFRIVQLLKFVLAK